MSFGTGLRLIAVIAILALAVIARDILVLGFIGVLFAAVMSYPVGWLSRKIPRGLATVIVLLAIIGGAIGLGAVVVPRLGAQFHSALEKIPSAVDRVQNWFERFRQNGPVSQLANPEQLANRLGNRVSKAIEGLASVILPAAAGLVSFIATGILVLVLAAFMIAQPEAYARGLRTLVPRGRETLYDESARRLGEGLRRWVGAIVTAMALMGAFTAVGLWAVGIQDWPLLAVLTFFGTFVPYLGAIASAIPGLLLGLAQSPKHFLFACGVYLAVHIVEGYIVEPFIMKRAVSLRPALLLFGQAVIGAIFGVIGIVIAAPLLVCLQILIGHLYVEEHLGKKVLEKKPRVLKAHRAAKAA